MTVNRRELVKAATGLIVGGTTAKAVSAPVETSRAESYSTWAGVRAQFDLAPGFLHFSQFYFVSHPRPVREAIERFRRQLDANPFTTVESGMGLQAFLSQEGSGDSFPVLVQRAAAEYIGGQPDEIALTDSTTQGLALIYQGLPLQYGDEVLTTNHDHYSHHESIRLATLRSGSKWRRISLYENPAAVSLESMKDRLLNAIRPRTRVVGLTWVSSASGVKLPIRALSEVIASVNRQRADNDRVLLVVDGVHGFGNQDELVSGLGCDFFAAGTHKWLFAPRGTGIIWAPPQNWRLLRPIIPSFYSFDPFQAWELDEPAKTPTQASWISPGGFKAYEHQWSMTAAFDFHRKIGRTRIAERIAALNTLCKDGLAQIPKVKVLTPRDPALSAGIICFEVEGQSANETVLRLLGHKVFASTSPYKISHARLAPSLVNNEHEVELVLNAVRKIV